MEFGLKETSRLVADVTGSPHSGLGFTVFWLFMAEQVKNAEVNEPTRCSSSTVNVDLSAGKSTHNGFMTGIPVLSEL